ncbi:hypothetical protein [Sharpea azabuensis]|uniref:Uncharacterized protein n=1 Tax=Sharpea azabuensis TaxID=322505 RepID=A0A1H6VDJ9_9FIRM|nr:hypothetical protein [Sharpea azabuensis]MDD6512592.1 hypothetical protein [Sharpea azabuensis]SEI99917.1 hypothetical protein SAMN04487834_10432 [Sharpea azabuensis]
MNNKGILVHLASTSFLIATMVFLTKYITIAIYAYNSHETNFSNFYDYMSFQLDELTIISGVFFICGVLLAFLALKKKD